ncbi:MAG TPA: prenyltransferase/squalene oxidase repeat-containing protein [Burkholderiales bacterium]|nr:prenyltransferase/squalene oxidase repeat-containing protein [Burkholderiales bacterium]
MLFLRKSRSTTDAALSWFRAHRAAEQGVIVHTRRPVPYAEVTGYFVPTLYDWGELAAARSCLRWLVSIQLAEGGFPAPDGVPYSFDTAQVMRGLNAGLERGEALGEPLRRAADWMLGQIAADGRLATPSTELWGDIANDLIHVYAARPLIRAGELLGEARYVEGGRKIQAYYSAQPALLRFDRLSHFHAYAMEALCELGEVHLARVGMAEVERVQRRDGSVPAYPDVSWVCSTGVAQYAVVWYRLGNRDRADRALQYLETIQNPSGGFFGSYGKGAKYISGGEISWAVKYYLDAAALRGDRAHA